MLELEEDEVHGSHQHSHAHSHSHNGVECNGDHGIAPTFPGQDSDVVCAGYSWSQDRETVTITMPIGDVKGKDVIYKLSPLSLSMGTKGSTPFIDGELLQTVKPDESIWEVETVKGQRSVVAKLHKAQALPWGSLLKAK